MHIPLIQRLVVVLTIALPGMGSACASGSSQNSISRDLSRYVDQIIEEPIESQRTERAVRLSTHIENLATTGQLDSVSDKALSDIARLLHDPRTSFSACLSLMAFGPRAHFAIPAIQTAISDMEAERLERERAYGDEPFVVGFRGDLALASCLGRIRDAE